jgi:hypothetical protein
MNETHAHRSEPELLLRQPEISCSPGSALPAIPPRSRKLEG